MKNIRRGNDFLKEIISPYTAYMDFLGHTTLLNPEEKMERVKDKVIKITQICDYYVAEKEKLIQEGEQEDNSHIIKLINQMIDDKKCIEDEISAKSGDNSFVCFMHFIRCLKSIDPEAIKGSRMAMQKIARCKIMIKLKQKTIEKETAKICKLKKVIIENESLIKEYSRI